MNELIFQVGSSSWAMLLFKATLVLAIGWIVHFCVNPIHAQWRCRLWRFGVVLLIAALILNFVPSQLNVAIERDNVATNLENDSNLFPRTYDSMLSAEGRDPSTPVAETQPMASPQNDIKDLANSTDKFKSSSSDLENGHGNNDSESSFIATVLNLFANPSACIAGIWMAGILFLSFRRILISFIAYKRLGITESISEIANQTYWGVAQKMGVHNAPQVCSASGLNSPCLIVFPKKQILLPRFMAEDSEFDIKSVFAHELAHYQRSDWFWNLLFQLLSICLWFHPLAWKIGEAHLNECENACDDLASKVTGSRLEYQQSLAQVALNLQGHSSVGLAMARKSEVMARLRRLETPLRNISARQLLFLLTLLPAFSIATGLFGFNFVVPPKVSIQKPDDSQANSDELSLQITGIPQEKLQAATVDVSYFYKGAKKRENITLKPDKDGKVRYKFDESKTLSYLVVVSRAPGFVPHAIQRNARHSQIIVPSNYEAKLEKGRTIRGTVKDIDGRLVAGALVELDMKVQDTDDATFAFDLANLKSDANGKWSTDVGPWYLQASGVHGEVSHPNYLAAWTSNPNVATDDASFDAVLQKGTTFIGKVVDEKGNPIAGASISLGSPVMLNAKIVKSDMAGEFRFENCRAHQNYLVATIAGMAPTFERVNILAKQVEEDRPTLVMKPGQKLEATIVDQYGKPAVDVRVGVQDWRESHTLAFSTRTDENGKFVMEDAPEDGVWFTFNGNEHRLIVHHELFAGRADQVVTLNKKQTVKFKVLDEKTGKPIPLGWMRRAMKWTEASDRVNWDSATRGFKDGEFEYTFTRQVAECWLRICSEGYESKLFKFKLGEPDKELTVKLKYLTDERERDWETVRTRIENKTLPMKLDGAANNLRAKGASVRVEKAGDWHIKLADKYTIPSARLGVPNLIEDESQKTWKGSVADIKELKDLPKVRLTLNGFMLNSDLIETLADCQNIVSIDFDDCPLDMTDEDWDALSQLTTLEEVYLDGHWQKFPKAAAKALAALPRLEKLEFGRCGAFQMGSETFAGELSKMQSIKHLSLSSDNGFDNKIGEEIGKLKNLESLEIRGRKIDSKFIESLNGLNLTSLDLYITSVDDSGLQLIANQFKDLKKLNIGRTKITPDGIKDVLTRFKNLESLKVDEMKRDVIVQFKSSHPRCNIWTYEHIAGGVRMGPFVLAEEEKKQIEK